MWGAHSAVCTTLLWVMLLGYALETASDQSEHEAIGAAYDDANQCE